MGDPVIARRCNVGGAIREFIVGTELDAGCGARTHDGHRSVGHD